MANVNIQPDLREYEETLRIKYSLYSKLLLIIAIVLVAWIAVVGLGSILYKFGYNWAGLSLDNWMIVACSLIGIFILLNFLMYLHYKSQQRIRIEKERPKPEYINGKRIHTFTYPKGIDGGIFSKTHIVIDEHTILRLRTLMIPPEDLWKNE